MGTMNWAKSISTQIYNSLIMHSDRLHPSPEKQSISKDKTTLAWYIICQLSQGFQTWPQIMPTQKQLGQNQPHNWSKSNHTKYKTWKTRSFFSWFRIRVPVDFYEDLGNTNDLRDSTLYFSALETQLLPWIRVALNLWYTRHYSKHFETRKRRKGKGSVEKLYQNPSRVSHLELEVSQN